VYFVYDFMIIIIIIIKIFGHISTPFGTLATCDLSMKILRRSSPGKPSVGGGELNQRKVSKSKQRKPLMLEAK